MMMMMSGELISYHRHNSLALEARLNASDAEINELKRRVRVMML
jgi:hypothetical protein